MLAAMDNPALTIIGHPTGRLLLSRDPYGLDLDAIIARAAANGIALEVNGDPHRLDLDWRVLPAVRAAVVQVSIGADAHSIAGLVHVDFGVAIARKGGLGPDDILNARDVDGFLAFARARKQ
jgi:DNA polymerase (family 10)